MYKKLLVAIDSSEMSQQVFDKAVSLAKTNNANLTLLHVLNPLDEPYYVDPAFAEPTILQPEYQDPENEKYLKEWEKLQQDRSNWLNSQFERAKQAGLTIEVNQLVGEASRTICDVARKSGTELIIIGRRGRRGLSEFFLGSVSNYVLHNAPCSVLVVQDEVNVTDRLRRKEEGRGKKEEV